MAELRICLDPGHGRLKNPGYVKGFYEGTNNYKLALLLKEELEKYQDIKVFVTRDKLDDGTRDGPDLPTRGQFAIDNKCDVMYSIHSNAYSSTAACGLSCFRSVLRPDSEELVRKLANNVVSLMRAETGITYLRGDKVCIRRLEEKNKNSVYYNQDYYGIIRNSVKRDGSSCVKYAFIIEHGFHTNPKECAFLDNDANRQKLAALEAKTIAEYFGKRLKVVETVKPTTPATPAPTFKLLDEVKFKETATHWASGKAFPSWIKKEKLYIRSAVRADGKTIKVSTLKEGDISGTAYIADLEYYNKVTTTPVVTTPPKEEEKVTFKEGDRVKFKSTAKTWAGGQLIPSWVKSSKLYIRSEYRHNGEWIVVSTLKTGAVTGTAKVEDLTKIN